MDKEKLINKLELINVYLIAGELGGMSWVKLASNMPFNLVEELQKEDGDES